MGQSNEPVTRLSERMAIVTMKYGRGPAGVPVDRAGTCFQALLTLLCQTALFIDFLETGFVFLLLEATSIVIFQTKFRVPIYRHGAGNHDPSPLWTTIWSRTDRPVTS